MAGEKAGTEEEDGQCALVITGDIRSTCHGQNRKQEKDDPKDTFSIICGIWRAERLRQDQQGPCNRALSANAGKQCHILEKLRGSNSGI